MKTFITLFLSLAVLSLVVHATKQQSSITQALGVYVFPAQGQDSDTQEFDEFNCYKWAKEQSGVDPLNMPDIQPTEVSRAPQGQMIRSAGKSAAMGAAIGAISGDAGKGAAIGATTGGFVGLAQRRSSIAHQQQASNASVGNQKAAMLNDFKRAFTVCMEGKGYTIK